MAQITPFTNMPNNSSELPFISILVLSYNQSRFIRECAQSVLSAEYEGKLEIVFCDDCSTDETFEIIKDVVTSYTGTHRIICHKRDTNGRVAANMNTAVSLSSGDWIMRVDGDDVVHPDRLRITAHIIQTNHDVSAVSGQLCKFTDTKTHVTNPPVEYLKYIIGNRLANAGGYAPFNKISWWGGAMTMSRRVFTEFAPIPEDCGIMDDTFFGARALMLGNFFIASNACFLYYRRHETNISAETTGGTGILSIIKNDHACRDYYKRSLHCHAPILQELELYTATHPDCKGLLEYFRTYLAERERQALFWEKSWKERIADAGIKGAWWRKIPWALRTLCPFTWALAKKLGKH